jgi:hypothetical protein
MSCCERGCDSRLAQYCYKQLDLAHHACVDSGLLYLISPHADSPRSLLPAWTRSLLSLNLSLGRQLSPPLDVTLGRKLLLLPSSPMANSFRRCLVVSLGQQLTLSPGHLLWPTAFAVAWSSPLPNSSHCHLVESLGQQLSPLPACLPWPTAHTVAWLSPMANSFCRHLMSPFASGSGPHSKPQFRLLGSAVRLGPLGKPPALPSTSAPSRGSSHTRSHPTTLRTPTPVYHNTSVVVVCNHEIYHYF